MWSIVIQKDSNQSQSEDDEDLMEELEFQKTRVKKIKEKLDMISQDVDQQIHVKERLKCQFNLMKLQVVMLMSQIDDKAVAVTDEKVNFKDKLQKTRVKKATSVTPRDGTDSSRSHSINTIASTNQGAQSNRAGQAAAGEDLTRQVANSMERKV